MSTLSSIRELIRALSNNEPLITALFEERNRNIRMEDALEVLGDRPERIDFLIEKEIITRNDEFLELLRMGLEQKGLAIIK